MKGDCDRWFSMRGKEDSVAVGLVSDPPLLVLLVGIGSCDDPGAETAGVSTEPSEGLWSRMVSMVTGGVKPHNGPVGSSGGPRRGEVINLFTVASGHMYERLQKIMILSVLEHTSDPLKFWFIKNYMSPQMKVTKGQVYARAVSLSVKSPFSFAS
eukprot:scaffold189728_cov35-Prasinocladus_malaysianus.AAC.1